MIANEVIVLAVNSEAVGGRGAAIFRVEKIGSKVSFVLILVVGGECLKPVVIAFSISFSEANASRSGNLPR